MQIDAEGFWASSERSSFADAERLLRTPPPDVAEAEAVSFAARYYRPNCRVRPLAGERDRNFLISDDTGCAAVLKFYNSADDGPTRALQHGALDHIRLCSPECPVPEIIRAVDGRQEVVIERPGLSTAAVMISYLPGVNPVAADLTPALRGQVGRMIGKLSRALADYDHPRAKRSILWDMMMVGELQPLVELIEQPTRRSAIAQWLTYFTAEISPAAASLIHQPIHNDLSLSNLLIDPEGRDRITGIIDFGDIVFAPRINEFAVAASYFIAPQDDPATAAADILLGAGADVAFEPREIALLPDLIKARLATRILLSGWRAQLFPDNRAYILRSNSAAWMLWARMADEDSGQMAGRISALLTGGKG